MKTFPEVFRAQAERVGSKVCITLHGDEAASAPIKTLTYAQLQALFVNKSLLYSKQLGLKPGATLALRVLRQTLTGRTRVVFERVSTDLP